MSIDVEALYRKINFINVDVSLTTDEQKELIDLVKHYKKLFEDIEYELEIIREKIGSIGSI